MSKVKTGRHYRLVEDPALYPQADAAGAGYGFREHFGMPLTVVRDLGDDERASEVGRMWEVRADYGWVGHVFDAELEPVEAGFVGREASRAHV